MKVIIIGAGISGLTASIYLSRANISTIVFSGYEYGNLSNSPLVENFPGFPEGISGFDLINNMINQTRKFGTEIIDEKITCIDVFNHSIISDTNNKYEYDYLIVATGTKPRLIEAKNSDKFINKGIHYCATCDGSLYKDKEVIVVGGGNTAFTEALYLSDICKKVNIFIRKNYARAENKLMDKILSKNNIEIFYESIIKEFCGDDKLEKIIYNSKYEIKEMNIDAVFVAIGFEYNDSILIEALGKNYRNSLPNNIELIGDLIEEKHQAVIASGNGAKIALKIIDKIKNNYHIM